MKIIRAKGLRFVPASHEDKQNPRVWKKILFSREDLIEGRVQMVNWAKLPAGNSFKAHYHEDMDEIFILVKGSAMIKADDKQANLEKGDAALVSMQEVHTMENTGEEEAEYIVLGITRDLGGKTINI